MTKEMYNIASDELKNWILKANALGLDGQYQISTRLVDGKLKTVLISYRIRQKKIIIPPVDIIDEQCFKRHREVEEIIIPETVKILEKEVFSYCDNLKSVDLSRTRILILPPYSFFACSKLKEVKMPDTLMHIGNNSFTDCLAIEKIILPESIRTIDKWVFVNNISLKSITIPKKVVTINSEFISFCEELEEIIFLNNKFGKLDKYTLGILGSGLNNLKTIYVRSDTKSRLCKVLDPRYHDLIKIIQ